MSDSVIDPQYGPSNPTSKEEEDRGIRRYASVIGLVPEKEKYYRELHAAVWPGVLDRLRKSNVRNYSIHLAEINGTKYLFSYLEYAGTDFEADMRAVAEDPETRRWWKETDPCQFVLDSENQEERWTPLERVFLME